MSGNTQQHDEDDNEAALSEGEHADPNKGKVLKILEKSLTVKQLLFKISSAGKAILNDTPWLQTGNIILYVMMDLFIGILLSFYITRTFPNLYEIAHRHIEDLLGIVLQILGWLSGVPAGLKLNASLNSLLGRFFSYNLHLWRNYIIILEPVLKYLLSSIVNIGFVSGFTVQVALVKDIISITTFHIYCLYIYATRLFNVELNALKSLGHLFIGRKWNPLRNRIDSVHLSHSEMFLSSLSFTIAVFLSPTIIIYYVVFLGLRLPILIVESFLKFVIQAANAIEILSSFLSLINSPLVPHEIYLEPTLVKVSSKDRSCVTASTSSKMGDEHKCTVRYEIQIRSTYQIFKPPNIGKSIRQVISKIIQSKVITN